MEELNDARVIGMLRDLERAYRIVFNLTNHEGDEIPRYWVGYFDASPRRSGPAVGYKKRKITPCEEDE